LQPEIENNEYRVLAAALLYCAKQTFNHKFKNRLYNEYVTVCHCPNSAKSRREKLLGYKQFGPNTFNLKVP